MLSTYETCPYQFRLKYIDRIDTEKAQNIEAYLGSRVHDTLERLHKDLILSRLNTVEELTEYYKSLWEKNWHKNIRISKQGLTEKNYFDTGKRAIREYYKRYYPFTSTRTLATEKMLFFKLRNNYSIRGFIDRVDITKDGTYEIHDYKTSSTLPADEHLTKDRQLALYQIGLKEHYRDADKVNLIWHYLVFDKEFVIEKTDEELEEIEARTVEIIKTIESATGFKPRESNLCGWCDYPEYCPAQKHIVKTGTLSTKEFHKENGVCLVNRYVELKVQIDLFKEELKTLKEDIITYANTGEITSLRGSDHILKINQKDTMRFPSTNEPDRVKLEELIKNADKWEDVSILNTNMLKKVISESRWDKELLKGIEGFGKPDKEIRISIKKLKEKER